jgi:hypothetical protein
MSTFRGVARHPLVRTVLRTLLALCVGVLVGSPLLPHDLACHVKARTDCTACTLDCASGDVKAHGSPGATALAPQGDSILAARRAAPLTPSFSPVADRAPPA